MSKIDLLSNWVDLTYANDNIRFATTALNEIYRDYAVADEIMIDKTSGHLSYKRKDDEQIIRPIFSRKDNVEDIINEIMCCTQDVGENKFKYVRRTTPNNGIDPSLGDLYLQCYNYNLGYTDQVIDIFNVSGTALIKCPEFLCSSTDNNGIFIRLNLDKDALVDTQLIGDFKVTVIVDITIYTAGNKTNPSGGKMTTKKILSCQLGKYTYVPVIDTLDTNIVKITASVYGIQSVFSSLKGAYTESFWENTQSFKNGGKARLSSIDIACINKMYFSLSASNLGEVYQPVIDARMKSPGSTEVNPEYIYPILLNAIVPLAYVDRWRPVETINAIPDETGILSEDEELIFCSQKDTVESQFSSAI